MSSLTGLDRPITPCHPVCKIQAKDNWFRQFIETGSRVIGSCFDVPVKRGFSIISFPNLLYISVSLCQQSLHIYSIRSLSVIRIKWDPMYILIPRFVPRCLSFRHYTMHTKLRTHTMQEVLCDALKFWFSRWNLVHYHWRNGKCRDASS